jgi:hypothetical protein
MSDPARLPTAAHHMSQLNPQGKKTHKRMATIVLGAALSILAGGAVVMAAPASAGCQSVSVGIFGRGSRCDGPIDPQGNFTRCDQGRAMGFGCSTATSSTSTIPHSPPTFPNLSAFGV